MWKPFKKILHRHRFFGHLPRVIKANLTRERKVTFCNNENSLHAGLLCCQFCLCPVLLQPLPSTGVDPRDTPSIYFVQNTSWSLFYSNPTCNWTFMSKEPRAGVPSAKPQVHSDYLKIVQNLILGLGNC